MRLPDWWPKWLGGGRNPQGALADEFLLECGADFQRYCSARWISIPCDKRQLAVAVQEADRWLQKHPEKADPKSGTVPDELFAVMVDYVRLKRLECARSGNGSSL